MVNSTGKSFSSKGKKRKIKDIFVFGSVRLQTQGDKIVKKIVVG